MCGGRVSSGDRVTSWDAILTLVRCGASYAQLTLNNFRLFIETHVSAFELHENVLLPGEVIVTEFRVLISPRR